MDINLPSSDNASKKHPHAIADSPFTLLNETPIEEGHLLIYYSKDPFTLNVSILEKRGSNKLLWQSPKPLWQSVEKITPKKISVDNRIISFHYDLKQKPQKKTFLLDALLNLPKKSIPGLLNKPLANPILTPKSESPWESWAVFNPAALYLGGKVHFIYRAVGTSGLSILGYASSRDGIHVDERLANPVFYARNPINPNNEGPAPFIHNYQSGINWGGCEDPRLTKIGDTIYMTYTSFNGWYPPSVALTSISVEDFLNKRWNWKPPVLLSPPHQIHKNWVLFPEKFNGKFALLHSIAPNILVNYFDDLSFSEGIYIHSYYHSSGQKYSWDNWIRGVGAPPIKTTEGWLVLYHAMDRRDPNKYKIGAMILDNNNPTQILYRSSHPLIEPDTPYENHGYKPGVVYNCGAVVIDENLFIYYGGADTVVCVAYVKLNQLLTQLKKGERLKLDQIQSIPKIPR